MTVFVEGVHYRWVSRFDRYIGKNLPFWYSRRAELLIDYEVRVGPYKVIIPTGTRWNGPSIGIAYPELMRASLVHDHLYTWRFKYPTITQKMADEVYVAIAGEDGASNWYQDMIFHPITQMIFEWAWERKIG